MSDAAAAKAARASPGARQYQALCGLFLGAIFLADLQQGALMLSLLLFLVGSLGVLSPGRLAPLMLLGGILATQLFKQFGWRRLGMPWLGDRGGIQADEVFLALAVLGYVLSHYRWQSLVHNILPLDRRRREYAEEWPQRSGPVVPQRRSADQVTRLEISLLVISLPVWALLAQLAWTWLRFPPDLQGWRPGPARVLLAVWVVGMAALLARVLLAYWRRRQDSPAIAGMVLQDTLWKESRREQRRINRWLAWKRIKDSKGGGT